MKVDGLTRHNIASHLQKYRAHIRHKKFREDEVARGRCWQRFDAKWTVSAEGGYQKPHFPTVGAPAPLHVWGSPTTHHSATQMWQHFPVGTPLTWAAQSSPFGNHPTGSSEAWGCPPSYGTTYYTNGVLSADVIDEAIKEALKNPWSPLPLGLKPPSIESVIAELQRQGINKLPPSAAS
eukprot:TRINITY_DN3707_c0_g1_i13.p1 TRINITY_DN3707_c0_g1~~TRINITY_DN3707_c0_g1_i13.p1  ORF type:complete len:179 (-),score=24.91 TRINITY_DN3707_c0_g1_i13:732-1268(-)